jgi:hypothetical protein
LFIYFNKEEAKKVSAGCFGKALVETHLQMQKQGLLNLISHLFDKII